MSRRIGISGTISKGRRRRVMTLGLKQVLLRALHSERETVTEVCRKIYGFNEVMFEERRSASYLADLLERRGFRVERGAAGLETAFARVLIDRLGRQKPKRPFWRSSTIIRSIAPKRAKKAWWTCRAAAFIRKARWLIR